MKKFILIIPAIFLLASCSKAPSDFTKQDLVDDKTLRDKVKTWCDADETRWSSHSDCIKLSKAISLIKVCKDFKMTSCQFKD